jgi:tRNA nucleotidyltransferase (CCA-adding enzyme)
MPSIIPCLEAQHNVWYDGDMKIDLPSPVQQVLTRLKSAGYEAYVVGGAVRDLLTGNQVTDWDFTTNATPEQVMKVFPDGFYDNQFGTVGIAEKYLNPTTESIATYEITTYRSEGVYTDHRRPDSVTWGKTIQDDLKRRDFTINALALAEDNTVMDPFHGQEDLEKKLIRAVGVPTERFQEDALRMMRAIRFSAQLGFTIEPKTLEAITKQADLIAHISWERIRDEFLKILVSKFPVQGVEQLASTGLLKHILPELLEARGVDQARHHIYDVWTHTLNAVESCPSKDPIVRFAVLLHDIAKPITADHSTDIVTFFNHEVVGARVAKKVAERFRLSKKDVQRIFTLVRWHMFVYDTKVTDAYIRRFIRRVGLENIQDMIALRVADRIGSGSKATSWRLEEMKERIEAQLHQPFSKNDMKIDGDDLMKELGLKPGPQIGKILNELFEEVVEDPEKNTREYLLGKAKKLLS